jgi:hypothetical protein
VLRGLPRPVDEEVAERREARPAARGGEREQLLAEALRAPVRRAGLRRLGLVERPAAHAPVRIERRREHDLPDASPRARLDQRRRSEGVRAHDVDQRLALRAVLHGGEMEDRIDVAQHGVERVRGRLAEREADLRDVGQRLEERIRRERLAIERADFRRAARRERAHEVVADEAGRPSRRILPGDVHLGQRARHRHTFTSSGSGLNVIWPMSAATSHSFAIGVFIWATSMRHPPHG